MTTGEKRCDWWSVLLGDDELFANIHLPAHVTDGQFISLLQQVSSVVETLDCSDCCQLSQEAFITLSRTPVVLHRLLQLTVPTELTLPNAVYEALANSSCLPSLQCIDNIQPGSSVCHPLRCQAYFKRSELRVLNDSPVASYGRARKLLLTDSSDHKQRRQRWEADLAKAAIYCASIDTYRCTRGMGYVDDKSLERLSVLFPRLASVELRQCGVTDEGLVKFCQHNRHVGGLSSLVLDHPGDLSDRAVYTVADHCTSLGHFTLKHCPRVTNTVIRYLLGKCRQLTELILELGEGVDSDTLTVISQQCHQLHVLRLYGITDPECVGLNSMWSSCTQLRYVTLHGGSPHLNDTSLVMMSQRCRHLTELSVNSDVLTLRGLLDAMMRAGRLQRLSIHGNTHLQQRVDIASVAEQTYHQLSDDVTCRASALRSLVMTSCSCDVIQLVTALCSQLLHLQLIHCTQGSNDWTVTLCGILDSCPQLHTLDISSLQSAVTEAFLADLCEKAIELRRLALHLAPHSKQSDNVATLLTSVVQVCPSLAELSLTVTTQDVDRTSDVVSRVVDAVGVYHGGQCHRRDTSLLSDNHRQIQLTFTPLKLLSVVATCPYL